MQPNESVPNSARVCGHCGSPLEPSSTVHLWDGRDYCRRCVEDLCPELVSYAAEHSQLEERMPYSAWRFAWRYLVLIELTMLPLFGGICFAAAVAETGERPWIESGLYGLLLGQLLIVPVALLFAGVIGSLVASQRPGVSARGGRLTVTGDALLAGEHDLAHCGWFVGKTCQMTLGKNVLAPFLDRAILLAPSDAFKRRERFIAVGFSEESRRRWEAFLTLAGAPRWTAREHGEGALLRGLRGVGGILAPFSGSLLGCFVLGRVVTWGLTALVGNQDVASAVGSFCFLPGGLYVAMYVMMFWPWTRVKWSKAKHLTAEEVREMRGAQLCLSLVVAGMIGLPMLAAQQFGVTGKVVYLSLLFVSLGLFAYDFAPRVFAIRWATTETQPEDR